MLGHIGQRTVAALSDASGLAAQQIMAKHIRLASAIALRGGAIWHLAAVALPPNRSKLLPGPSATKARHSVSILGALPSRLGGPAGPTLAPILVPILGTKMFSLT